jgi:hypothetical protein
MIRTTQREPTTPRTGAHKRRAGLPDDASVVAETEFTSPKGTRYRILKTNEKDPYDNREPPKSKPRGGE